MYFVHGTVFSKVSVALFEGSCITALTASLDIEHTLEQLGLDAYIDELTNALSILVLTTLEPYVAPIIKTVTEGLTAGSSAILQQEDQLLVFNDDDASE